MEEYSVAAQVRAVTYLFHRVAVTAIYCNPLSTPQRWKLSSKELNEIGWAHARSGVLHSGYQSCVTDACKKHWVCCYTALQHPQVHRTIWTVMYCSVLYCNPPSNPCGS